MEITGSTTVYAIAADPIAHVKTPQRLNALLRERGADGVMVPFHVSPDGLPALFAGLRGLHNLGGLVVTVPHKEQAAVLCDEITPAARLIGAVNAIRLRDGKLAGGNFDRLGFVAGLRAQGHEPAGRRVYLAGLGGAGKAIACALADAGPARLNLYNRSPNAPANSPPAPVDAAPGARDRRQRHLLGLSDTDPLPLPAGADAVMSRVDTRAAAARGAAHARRPAHAGRTDRRDCPLPGHTGAALGSARQRARLIHGFTTLPFHGGDTHEIGFHHRPAVPGRHRPSAQAAPVKIGLIETLSGPQASTGLIFRAAVKYQLDRINAAGGWNGQPLELVEFDNQGGPVGASDRFRAAAAEGVQILVQGSSSAISGQLTEDVRKHNLRNPGKEVLFLNVGGEALELTGQKCHFYHFRFATNADLRVKALTSVMSADGTLGKRVYAINQNYSWGQDMEGATERFAKQYGYEVVGKTLHEVNKIQDFAPYVARIRSANPDTVITGNWSNDLLLLMKPPEPPA